MFPLYYRREKQRLMTALTDFNVFMLVRWGKVSQFISLLLNKWIAISSDPSALVFPMLAPFHGDRTSWNKSRDTSITLCYIINSYWQTITRSLSRVGGHTHTLLYNTQIMLGNFPHHWKANNARKSNGSCIKKKLASRPSFFFFYALHLFDLVAFSISILIRVK